MTTSLPRTSFANNVKPYHRLSSIQSWDLVSNLKVPVVDVELFGSAFLDRTSVADIYRPILKVLPQKYLNNIVNCTPSFQNLEYVVTWKGLSVAQANEVGLWEQIFKRSLEIRVGQILAKTFREWLWQSVDTDSYPPMESHMAEEFFKFINRKPNHTFTFHPAELIQCMLELHSTVGRYRSWLVDKNMEITYQNLILFLGTQECFTSDRSLCEIRVENCRAYPPLNMSYNENSIKVCGQLVVVPPKMEFTHIEHGVKAAHPCRITPKFVDAKFQVKCSGLTGGYVSVNHEFMSDDISLTWNESSHSFEGMVPTVKKRKPWLGEWSLEEETGMDRIDARVISVVRKFFPEGVRYEISINSRLLIDVNYGNPSVIPRSTSAMAGNSQVYLGTRHRNAVSSGDKLALLHRDPFTNGRESECARSYTWEIPNTAYHNEERETLCNKRRKVYADSREMSYIAGAEEDDSDSVSGGASQNESDYHQSVKNANTKSGEHGRKVSSNGEFIGRVLRDFPTLAARCSAVERWIDEKGNFRNRSAQGSERSILSWLGRGKYKQPNDVRSLLMDDTSVPDGYTYQHDKPGECTTSLDDLRKQASRFKKCDNKLELEKMYKCLERNISSILRKQANDLWIAYKTLREELAHEKINSKVGKSMVNNHSHIQCESVPKDKYDETEDVCVKSNKEDWRASDETTLMVHESEDHESLLNKRNCSSCRSESNASQEQESWSMCDSDISCYTAILASKREAKRRLAKRERIVQKDCPKKTGNRDDERRKIQENYDEFYARKLFSDINGSGLMETDDGVQENDLFDIEVT